MNASFPLIVLLASSLLVGCGTRRAEMRAARPVVAAVCVDLKRAGDAEETAFVLRKLKASLQDTGFKLAESECDVRAAFTSFEGGQWETREPGWWGVRSVAYWRMAGILTITRGTTVVAEDLPIDLRDYKAKQELLTALCDAIAAHVETRFQPPPR